MPSALIEPGFFAARRRRLGLRWKLIQRALSHSKLRDDEMWLLIIALAIGVLAGAGVVGLRRGIAVFHTIMFGIPLDSHLSLGAVDGDWRVAVVPCLGGLVVGFAAWLIRRWRPHDIVDAIEANALYGGRMSLRDSINLGILSLLSGGFGASVGLEAAYTQLGAGLASRVGSILKLRRDDRRMLVACGAAAAIAAAFNAPLTGAFYAFELILGSYTLAGLAPVTVAALSGTFTSRWVFGTDPIFTVSHSVSINGWDYVAFMVLGLISAGLGIVIMRGVTATEGWFRQWAIPVWLRPAFGGLAIGLMALMWPQVLGSGHGAILADLHVSYALPYMIGLLLMKIAGSAISIGSGFRGGLFSSSLFLGSLLGGSIAMLIDRLVPVALLDPLAYSLVGMGTVGAAIVGAPTAMILLVLESTGDFSATVGVMIGVVTATIAVRHWFGYSFATWRFHLRGLKIQSPEDVGWIDDIKVGRLMRGDPKSVPVEMTVSALRRAFPLGSIKQVFAVKDGHYAGMIDMAEAYSPDLAGDPVEMSVGDLVHEAPYLLPGYNIRMALARFSEAQMETLPVVDDPEAQKIVGYLTEAYALRRYSQELERRRGESDEDSGLFSPTATPG